ncbi:MAG: DUF697 domain-containing protein [Actinobacteria bacterium]|nr:MAG: DUF697 domain-containing protein [Actinomycetota bacterium]
MHEQREEPVRLVVLLEPGAPNALLDAVRRELHPQTSRALVAVEVVERGFELLVDPSVDAVVAVSGPGGEDLKRVLDPIRYRGIPVAVLGIGQLKRPLADALVHPLTDTLVGPDADAVVTRDLADWFCDRLASKRLALSYNFEFVRREVARDAVNATAWQNALIGGISIIPGEDMPLMTANQAKMLLQIAAAYGQRLGPDRIKELAAVVGGGFLMRTAARQLLTLVPGFGWAVKAAIGFTGTMAMGKAAIRYFENGADLSQAMHGVVEVRDRVVEKVRANPALAGRRHAAAVSDAAVAEVAGVPAAALPPAGGAPPAVTGG